MLKVGDKVVPFKKSLGSRFSRYLDMVRDGNIDYLYIIEIDEDGCYTLNKDKKEDGGDYFKREDFHPYNGELLGAVDL